MGPTLSAAPSGFIPANGVSGVTVSQVEWIATGRGRRGAAPDRHGHGQRVPRIGDLHCARQHRRAYHAG
jgi:hypothetical protein